MKFHGTHGKLSPQQKGKLTILLLKGKSFVSESVLHHGIKRPSMWEHVQVSGRMILLACVSPFMLIIKNIPLKLGSSKDF